MTLFSLFRRTQRILTHSCKCHRKYLISVSTYQLSSRYRHTYVDGYKSNNNTEDTNEQTKIFEDVTDEIEIANIGSFGEDSELKSNGSGVIYYNNHLTSEDKVDLEAGLNFESIEINVELNTYETHTEVKEGNIVYNQEITEDKIVTEVDVEYKSETFEAHLTADVVSETTTTVKDNGFIVNTETTTKKTEILGESIDETVVDESIHAGMGTAGAGVGAVLSVGKQLMDKGTVCPTKTLKDAAKGAGMSVAKAAVASIFFW
eukprot:896538_1